MNTIATQCVRKVVCTQPLKINLLRLRSQISYRSVVSSNSVVRSRLDTVILNIVKHKVKATSFSAVGNISRLLCTSRNRCWKCNAVVTERDLVCLSCGCVQEPRQNLNNFEIFKEAPHFDIDVRNLSIKFRRLQTMLHPDKFATRSEKEQKFSLEQSSRVNKAYQMLYHPLDRGLYLLELHGKPLLEGEVTMPEDFFQDIIELNEKLVESTAVDVIESMRHVNNAKLEVLFAELAQSFKEKNIERARELLAKLKYYVNIDNQIKKKEDELGISRDD